MAIIPVVSDWRERPFPLKELIDYIASIGCECFEVQMLFLPQDEKGQDEIVAYALSKGVKINIHSYFAANNIIDTDEENRKLSVSQLKQSIDFAARNHLGPVTFHPGRLSSQADDPKEKWELLLETVGEVALYAKEKKVRLAVENMEKRDNELVFTIDDLNRFAPFGEDNPYFGVTIDFAHFASHGIISPALEELKLPVFNVHISQYTPDAIHLPLTAQNGKVDVREACRLLKNYGYDSFVVLESHLDVPESAKILLDAYESV